MDLKAQVTPEEAKILHKYISNSQFLQDDYISAKLNPTEKGYRAKEQISKD